MDILDYVLLPHIHVLHMVFAFFPFVIINYISYLSSSMLTFIALNDYITRRLILTTIILLYNSSATTLRASSFWPNSAYLFRPSMRLRHTPQLLTLSLARKPS